MDSKTVKFFLDTEFSERGPEYPVTLISIGIVAEDGRTFYAINADFDPDTCNDWVKENVISQLDLCDGWNYRASLDGIRTQFRKFVGDVTPEFWGYYADYDWVITAQIFGTMMDLPKGWPMYCRDIKQLCDSKGNPKLPEQRDGEHNALADAEWNKTAYEFLVGLPALTGAERIATERARQIATEGWSSEHDSHHQCAELTRAAMSYADSSRRQIQGASIEHGRALPWAAWWPWEISWWKPSDDPIRNLEKAGALLAAEIDNLLLAQSKDIS